MASQYVSHSLFLELIRANYGNIYLGSRYVSDLHGWRHFPSQYISLQFLMFTGCFYYVLDSQPLQCLLFYLTTPFQLQSDMYSRQVEISQTWEYAVDAYFI